MVYGLTRPSDPVERFNARWREEPGPLSTPCHVWIMSCSNTGYGTFGWNAVSHNAHRFGWEMLNGPVPEGLVLDHLCRVRKCVNPAHLEPVTQRENVRRSRNFYDRTHCGKGHEYTEKNTYIAANGGKRCRECHRVASNEGYHRRRQAA